jgi:glutathione S-transferase
MHLGLGDRVEWISSRSSDRTDPIDRFNPLGKMPVLLLDNGRSIYDSPVIVEYFDFLAGGGRLIPRDPDARFAVLTAAALADGLMDAAINVTHEDRWHPGDKRSEKWVEQQNGKMQKSLAAFEKAAPEVIDASAIGLAAALGYLDNALEGRWRVNHPRLVGWLDDFVEKVPAYLATAPEK